MPAQTRRFVILEHDHPFLHWDLMLERDDMLWTWRLSERPEPGRTVPAEQIADHRLMYLDYEGPVSRDRGAVSRFDCGVYSGDDGLLAPIKLIGKKLRGVLSAASGEARFE